MFFGRYWTLDGDFSTVNNWNFYFFYIQSQRYHRVATILNHDTHSKLHVTHITNTPCAPAAKDPPLSMSDGTHVAWENKVSCVSCLGNIWINPIMSKANGTLSNAMEQEDCVDGGINRYWSEVKLYRSEASCRRIVEHIYIGIFSVASMGSTLHISNQYNFA